jgi:subtilisin family serine protease
MSDPLEKLDYSLRRIYSGFLQSRQTIPTKDLPRVAGLSPRYNLTLRYEGNLSEIESQGFTTTWNEYTGLAHGLLRLDDLERVVSHPGVISLEYGARHEPSLDKSAPDIRARADSTSNVGTNGVWFVDPSNGDLSGTSVASGSGVIVGVIDSGIDIFHPVFMNTLSPFDTRILRIWDQGLDPLPGQGEIGPDKALITNANTYGVEFTRKMINDHLNGVNPATFRHKDCLGHGTHVAATAAGNGNPGGQIPLAPFAPGGFEFVGIAPRADIVFVKYLDTKNEIRDQGGDIVSDDIQFRDAVRYILNVAKKEGKPAAINCSFGSDFFPHDGLTSNEQFLDREFAPESGFFKGNIIVFASGNSGGRRGHAQVTIPSSGEITVPFELFDDRGAQTRKFTGCEWVDDTQDMWVQIWYREVDPPGDVSAAVKAPTESGFSGEVFNGSLSATFDKNKKRTISNVTGPKVKRPVPGSTPVDVQRNSITLKVEPNRSVDPPQHKRGIYEIRVKGPQGTVLHAWTSKVNRRFGFRVGPLTSLTADAGTGAGTAPDGLHVRNAEFFGAGDTIHVTLDDGTEHETTITSSTGGAPGALTLATGLPSPAKTGREIFKVPAPGIDVNDHNQVGSEGGAKYVITVGAYDDKDGDTTDLHYANITDFSSRGPLVDYSGLGPYAVKPDIAAPGKGIRAALSAFKDSLFFNGSALGAKFIDLDGTSMAAPHVTGAIALMLEKNRNLTVDDVRAIFANIANDRPGTGPTNPVEHKLAYGGGMLDAQGAHGAVP